MITLKNFSQYEPDYKAFEGIYLQTEDGLDWFYHRGRFKEDTLKICYDQSGIIRMYSYQADGLFPLGLSVTEVAKEKVPADLNNKGEWAFDGKNIVPRTLTKDEQIAEAEREKSRLMSDAEAVIAPLKRAVKYNMATDAEKSSLEQWEVYSVLLSRVDTSLAPDIEWPPVP